VIPNIAGHIKDKFGLDAEIEQAANVIFVRVSGLDNFSLARWIDKEFDELKITVKQREGYKFNNLGWIKIEQSFNKEFILS